MNTDKVKTLAIWLGLPVALVASWGAIATIASTVVFASDYRDDRRQQAEINLLILIDLNNEKLRRARDPSIKQEYRKKIERYEKQLEKLLEEKIK